MCTRSDFEQRVEEVRSKSARMVSDLQSLERELEEAGVDAGVLEQVRNMRQHIPQGIKDHEICVLGTVGAGKSTLLNAVLTGKADFLPDANDTGEPTTAAPTRVRHVQGLEEGFRATVSFRSVAEVLRLLEEHAMAVADGGQRDRAWNARMELFKRLFVKRPMYSKPEELDLLPLGELVGQEPRVLGSASAQGLAEQIREFLRLPDEFEEGEWVALVVDHVLVEGPFEHLPPGVTLIDLPGLEDANEARSQRALDSFAQADEVWLVQSCKGVFGKRAEQEQLMLLLEEQGHGKTMSVAGTKFDMVRMGEDKMRERIRAKVRQIVHTWVVKRRLIASDQELSAAETALFNDGVARVQQVLFSELEEDEEGASIVKGVEQWRSLLLLRHSAWLVRLEDAERRLEATLEWMQSLGVEPPANVPRAQVTQLSAALAGSLERVPESITTSVENQAALMCDVVAREGKWRELWPTTVVAVMDEWRRGVFTSRGQTRTNINVPQDIASVWLRVTGPTLSEVLSVQTETYALNLTATVRSWRECPDGVAAWVAVERARLLSTAGTARAMLLGPREVAAAVREELGWAGAFTGQEMPSAEMVRRVFSFLNNRVTMALRSLAAAVSRIPRAFENRVVPQDTLSESTRQRLMQMVRAVRAVDGGRDDAGVPEEFIDPVTFELLESPVVMLCCGNHFSRETIERHGRCPYCGVVSDWVADEGLALRIRTFLEGRIGGRIPPSCWVELVQKYPPKPRRR